MFNCERLRYPRNLTQSSDGTLHSNGYNLARERNTNGAERSTRQRRTPLFLGDTSWAKIRFFSLYWASSNMQEPRQGDIRRTDSPLLASGERERDVKAKGAPQASSGKRGALLTLRNVRRAKTEEGRSGAHSMLGWGEQRAAGRRVVSNFEISKTTNTNTSQFSY
ncbi:hypothetical protein CEXT_430481 [Caerostris extrusa]|uniref:Uncharacterized protein n=1 Tax=Caerostris extrusa TaxID=172846 RepID=A0AAV4XNW2_CAEEX|nr:hypothetical protein CEXT_430481 [Caerostris extrusa]